MGKIEIEKKCLYRGIPICLFRLMNRNGLVVELLNLGATLKSIYLPRSRAGQHNIVLGYDRIENYFVDSNYMGATIGRFANRISGATFIMDGQTYLLDKNDGDNCNHGGFSGFNRKIFESHINNDEVIMRAISFDGEGGFPGNMELIVTYRLTDENELCICYSIRTDRKTPANFTNHAYFNLSKGESILNHQLKIEAGQFLQSDDYFLPTGRVLDVDNYPAFDFRDFRKIGENMQCKNEKITGYNHYFIEKNNKKELNKIATLRCKDQGLSLEVHTTMPGIMIYTGDYLSGAYHSFSGISMEAHHYPDSLNKLEFPQNIFIDDVNRKEFITYRVIY